MKKKDLYSYESLKALAAAHPDKFENAFNNAKSDVVGIIVTEWTESIENLSKYLEEEIEKTVEEYKPLFDIHGTIKDIKLDWQKTPYGFSEAIYKGMLITKSDGTFYPKGYSINFHGDVVTVNSAVQAVVQINLHTSEGAKSSASFSLSPVK